jgi:translation initiation factor IF-2
LSNSTIKVITLAKQLKVTFAHLKDYMKAEGLEVPASPNASVSEEVYLKVLEQRAPELYREVLAANSPAAAPVEAPADIRRAQVEDILHQGEEPEAERFESERLETLKKLKVISRPEPPAPEPEPEPADTPEPPAVAPVEAVTPGEAPGGDTPAPAAAETPAVPEPPAAVVAPPAPEPARAPTGRQPFGAGSGEKIGLPVFTASKVLGYHHDPEPVKAAPAAKPVRTRKDGPAAPASTDVIPGPPPAETDAAGRKRSSKRTKTEEERLKRIEHERALPAAAGGGAAKKRKKGKKEKIDQREILKTIKETNRAMEGAGKKRRHRHVQGVGEFNEDTNTLRLTEFISANELASLLDEPVGELIKKAFLMGTMITINQRLEREVIELLCAEYDQSVEFLSEFSEDLVAEAEVETGIELPRAPVVTVMGHVDHGKTSVLDYIRKANVVSGESGGITQHIGAYEVVHREHPITFLDTPGHHSFTAMRARGAKVTDVVVLVVAADDRVQEQTLEAIDHALAAKVPIIVAINKVDKYNADPQKIRKELAGRNILVEDWGGTYQCVDISAKTGHNMEKLLEEILVCSEVLELKAVHDAPARGAVIESRLDKGRGALATVLVERGTLRKGDAIVVGSTTGRVRMMFDENGRERTAAPPSTPVQVIGLSEVPQAGDSLQVYESEKEARQVAAKRRQIQQEQNQQRIARFSLAKLSSQIAAGEIAELPVIIKGDVNGSIEAIADELMKMQTGEVRVQVVSRGVGTITENDVLLAKASGAVIVGFHVTPNQNARELAQREHVDVRLYKVIYDVVEEMKAGLEGMLRPELVEETVGTAEVRQVFRISRKVIAGCMMLSGKIERSHKVRVVRDNKVIHEGSLGSLKRFKDDVREVSQGYECGIQFDGFNDLKEGDLIHSLTVREVTRRLELKEGDA